MVNNLWAGYWGKSPQTRRFDSLSLGRQAEGRMYGSGRPEHWRCEHGGKVIP